MTDSLLVLPDSFWSRVSRGADCWLWHGSATPRGYGQLSISGVRWYAHRASYAAHVGPIPEGSEICHTCEPPRRLLTIDGVAKTVRQWGKDGGMSDAVIHMRLRAGWTAADAVTVPVGTRRRRTA